MPEEDDSGLLRRAQAVTVARIRFVVRLAKRRKGSILAVVVLSVFAAIALYGARDTDQYGGNLLLNIGASFVGAVVTYVLINPLVSRAANQEEKVLDRFDHANVIQHIHDSNDLVMIFETGVELLKEQYERDFLAACRAAVNGGVRFEILLLDPDCRAAEQRAEELRRSMDLLLLISKNLLSFRDFHADLSEPAQLRFEVRVYATSPLAAYYRWGRRALVAFFPTAGSSVDTTQYETSVDSNFAQFVERRFHESWEAPNTYTLQQYFELPFTIMWDSPKRESPSAGWVVLEDRLYLAHPDLNSYAMEYRLDRLQVRLDPVVSHLTSFAGVWRLKLCDAESPVYLSFKRKYALEYVRGERSVFEVLTSAVDTPPLSD